LLSPPGDETTLGLKKIAFFRKRSVDSIVAILTVLGELRATVAELVAKAEQNHQAYNKKSEIRTEETKTFWGNTQTTIRATSGRFKELEIKHLTSPISMDASEARVTSDIEVHQLTGKHTSDAIHAFIRELAYVAKDERQTPPKDAAEFLTTFDAGLRPAGLVFAAEHAAHQPQR